MAAVAFEAVVNTVANHLQGAVSTTAKGEIEINLKGLFRKVYPGPLELKDEDRFLSLYGVLQPACKYDGARILCQVLSRLHLPRMVVDLVTAWPIRLYMTV